MPRVTIIDAVDIFIVAFFAYKLLTLIRGTRATALIKGLVMIFAASAVSQFLGLTSVRWLLERGLTVLLVALPIVFYPELRKALEELGRGQIFPRSQALGHEELRRVVDLLTRAAVSMARKRTGALIVVERRIGLREYVESGVAVDAELSAELLENIFVPNSPLHDGAVIMRGSRIVAAGAFLPLTDKQGIDSQLGTRHRAALGISEHSDALALVVSEETGGMSLAVGGRLQRNLDEATLRDRLEGYWPGQEKPKSFLKRKEA